MRKLSDQFRDRRTAKQARIAARPPEKPPINNRFIALMLMQNERIQGMILSASQSTYVPIPKGDHRIMSNIDQFRKNQKRLESWTGLRA